MDAQLLKNYCGQMSELPGDALQLQTLDVLEQLGPWGQKFPLPTFEGTFAVLNYRWLKERHLKLRLGMENGQSLDTIAPLMRLIVFEFDPMQMQVRLVYRLEKKPFNGAANLQLHIIHLEQ